MKKKGKNELLIQEQVLRVTRQFFEERGFHEIVVPILNEGLPLEPNLFAFETHWHYAGKTHPRYLPTSPEAALKKALALGIEPVFAISPSFRNFDPDDEDHSPEFLMLEWYRADADYKDIMNEVEEYVIWIDDWLKNANLSQRPTGNQKLDLQRPWKRVSLSELFESVVNEPFAKFQSLEKMTELAQHFGYQVKTSNWEQLFNQFFAEQLEPLVGKQPVFLTDLPAQISLLCAAHQDEPHLAQRFELYLNHAEIANGNTEETNPHLIKNRFTAEQHHRHATHQHTPPIDQQLIQALEKLKKTAKLYAGVGLGLERLMKVLNKKP